MKMGIRILVTVFIGTVLFIGACSQEKDYSRNFAEPNEAPIGFFDVAKYENGQFVGIGWSADKEDGVPLKKVLVYIDGKAVGEASFVNDRPDVANMYKNDRWLKSGWRVSARVPLNKGPHSAMALSYDKQDALKVCFKDFRVD